MSEERRICVTHGSNWPCPSCARRAAEREVLEACVRHEKARRLYREHRTEPRGTEDMLSYGDMITAVRRYRALLKGKEAK